MDNGAAWESLRYCLSWHGWKMDFTRQGSIKKKTVGSNNRPVFEASTALYCICGQISGLLALVYLGNRYLQIAAFNHNSHFVSILQFSQNKLLLEPVGRSVHGKIRCLIISLVDKLFCKFVHSNLQKMLVQKRSGRSISRPRWEICSSYLQCVKQKLYGYI